MIKKFGFKNYFSFKEGVEISFEYDGNTPKNVTQGGHIGTVLGIKGANGSGKTNILKAISFLFCFVTRRMITTETNSADNSEEIKIPIEPFFFSTEITEFYIELELSGVIYYYELDISSSGIKREGFIRNKNEEGSKDVLFIERNNNEIIKCISEYSELKKIKLKGDQSIISLVSDFKFNHSMNDLIVFRDFFNSFIFNVGHNGLKKDMEENIKYIRSSFYKKNPDALNFVKNIIMESDDGISDIVIETIKNSSGDDVDFPAFIHEVNHNKFSLLYADESMGTKTLYNELFKYWLILKDGGVLIADEFDIHLHAMILPKIINLFTDLSINSKNSQLIVTAHNTEIIDDLGRYRTILVNKENNESYCYRLDEIPLLRNDRDISPFYKKGRIGGVPNFNNKNRY
ncbi:AAA family ATPase [Proteus sp. FME41]|uniref:AAA family ATPase n=1 Tax=Proteus sp. FME41 TaxID=2742608 RepID=UPI0018669967|nr:ATP-binding protein [Proteus sp. FME41]